MRFDLFMVILAILLLAAIVLTLLFGREHGRHGYGHYTPCTGAGLCIAGSYGPPLRTG